MGKLENRNFSLNTEKHFCAAWATQKACPEDSLEVSKSYMDMGLGTLLWVLLIGQMLEQEDP